MVDEEKLKNMCDGFLQLSEEKQDYILGITQALVFAEHANNHLEPDNPDNNES